MTTLEQFLKHGELGPVRIGMGADELMDVLGPPDGRTPAKSARNIHYGALHLTLTRSPGQFTDRVVMVGIQFQPQERELPEAVRPRDWLPTGGACEADFRHFLDRVGYPPHSSISGEGGRHIVLSSGARVSFVHDRLAAIQYALRGNPRTVAATLSNEAYLRLRELAKSENRTLSDLCSEILNERAAELQLG